MYKRQVCNDLECFHFFRQARGSRLFSSDNPCVNFFKFFFYPFPLAQSSIFPLVACTFLLWNISWNIRIFGHIRIEIITPKCLWNLQINCSGRRFSKRKWEFCHITSNYLYKARDFKCQAWHHVFVIPVCSDGIIRGLVFSLSLCLGKAFYVCS